MSSFVQVSGRHHIHNVHTNPTSLYGRSREAALLYWRTAASSLVCPKPRHQQHEPRQISTLNQASLTLSSLSTLAAVQQTSLSSFAPGLTANVWRKSMRCTQRTRSASEQKQARCCCCSAVGYTLKIFTAHLQSHYFTIQEGLVATTRSM